MPDWLFLTGELALIVLCGKWAIEGIQRLTEPEIRVPCQEWRNMVDPIVKKFKLAAKLEMHTTFNADGSKAVGELLERMADELDRRS